ncbi:MAG TPA: phosphatase PAP2 family protein, partial [Thermoanaerobaculia bacterium]|nr:phosphatase PAP2 family protein [Thermoanaerobaculia bacterium]
MVVALIVVALRNWRWKTLLVMREPGEVILAIPAVPKVRIVVRKESPVARLRAREAEAPVSDDLRRGRLTEAIVLLGLAAITTIVFGKTSLDLAAARVFYHPVEENPWASVHRFPWSALYHAAPWITASLILAGLGTLAVGLAGRRADLRWIGVFLLLSVVIGPGLVVNFLFKDHWGRPRPRDIVEFSGTSRYVPPLVPSSEGCTSFPCGHCSVGFLYGTGWWIWRRRHRGWAWASLMVGVIAGFAQGLGRMAAGGHFLSDVVWSGLLALGIAHLLYDDVLRIPARVADAVAIPAARTGKRSGVLWSTLSIAGGVAVLIALFGTPHGASLTKRIPLAPQRPAARWAFEFSARRAQVDLVLEDSEPGVAIDGELHGFGLPMSRLTTKTELLDLAVPTVRYSVIQQGWFTDLD